MTPFTGLKRGGPWGRSPHTWSAPLWWQALACLWGASLSGVGCNCGGEPIDALEVSVRAAPSALAFGDVPVGAESRLLLAIINEGSVPYNPSRLPGPPAGAPFLVRTPCVFPVAPDAFCEMEVAFAPTAEGPAEAALAIEVEGDDIAIALSGTAVRPAVLVTPTELAFGDVLVGSSAASNVVIENVGTSPLTLPITIDTAGFLVAGAGATIVTLDPGDVADLPVTFVPARGGAFSGRLTVEVCGVGCGPAVTLSGTGLAPRIDVAPRTIALGEIAPGAEASADLVVTNVGAGVLGVSAAELTSPTTDLTVDAAALPVALAEGESATIRVSYAPTGPRGALDATLFLVSSDPVSPRVAVPIGGSSPGPAIELLPSAVHFGVIDAGQSRTAGLVVRSIGTVPVNLTGVALSGAGFGLVQPPPEVTLEGGEALLFDIVATGTAALTAAGGATGTVTASAEGGMSATTTLQFFSGTAGCQPRGPDSNVNLGGVAVHQGITGEGIIRNVGDAPCTLTGVAPAAGLPFGPGFSFSVARVGTLAPGGGQGAVDFGFTPNTAGLQSAFLTLTFGNAPAPLLISATGVGVLGDLRGTPAALDFGPVVAGCAATPRAATFVNAGAAGVEILSITLDDPTGSFSLPTLPALPRALSPGASLSITVEPRARDVVGTTTAILEAEAVDDLSAQVVLRLEVAEEGQPVVESFEVGSVSTVDVLFVVDDSGSMQDEQATLAQNFSGFIASGFENDVDFHLGVTTTDVLDGAGGRLIDGYLTGGTPAIDSAFAQRALVGITGSGIELGLEATRRALEDFAGADNAGFWRTDAALSVVVVTDEEDSGELAAQVDPSASRPPEAYIESLLAAKAGNIANTPILFSVVGNPGSMPRYQAVVDAFEGVFLDIQQASWGASLAQLGDVTFGLQRRFTLADAPEAGTVTVFVDGVATTAFGVDGRTVTLDDTPPAGAVVEISYLSGCTP